MVAEAAKFKASIVNPYASGDGPHLDPLKTTAQADNIAVMKTLKSDFKEYNPSPEEHAVPKIDQKFVTLRKKPWLTQDVENSEEKSETSYFPTPVHSPKTVPRRKLSVYNRSFDVDSFQTPETTAQTTSTEKKRSISNPDVQEGDFTNFQSKSALPLVSKNELLTTYRCANNSDSSCDSPSPRKQESIMVASEESPREMQVPLRKPLVIAPTKFLDQTTTLNSMKNREVSMKDFSFTPLPENYGAHQSKIISASANLLKEENKLSDATKTVDVCKFGDNSTFNVGPSDVTHSIKLSEDTNASNNSSTPKVGQKHETFVIEGNSSEI